MMKYFEWTLELPEAERARLLRVYTEIRRRYDIRPDTDVLDELISRWLKEPKEMHRLLGYKLEQFEVWKAIARTVIGWGDHFELDKPILELVKQRDQRYTEDPDYRRQVEQGEIPSIEFTNVISGDDKPLIHWAGLRHSRGNWNGLYLNFNGVEYEIDARLNLVEALQLITATIKQLENEINDLRGFDFDSNLNTMEFVSSIREHFKDGSRGYFPDYDELTTYMMGSGEAESKFPDWMKSKKNLFAEHDRRYNEGKGRGKLTKEEVFNELYDEMIEAGFEPYYLNYNSFRASRT
jgi:hypothetical protein